MVNLSIMQPMGLAGWPGSADLSVVQRDYGRTNRAGGGGDVNLYYY